MRISCDVRCQGIKTELMAVKKRQLVVSTILICKEHRWIEAIIQFIFGIGEHCVHGGITAEESHDFLMQS